MPRAKINNYRNCDRFRIEGDLVWFKKCGRAETKRSSYALKTKHILAVADKIKEFYDKKQNRATGRLE